LCAGEHLVKIVAEQQYFNLNSLHLEAVAPSPYRGEPFAVPGAFEAEDFDLGGEGVAHHDNTTGNQGDAQFRTDEGVDLFGSNDPSGGAYIVKNFEAGEWLAYTINVPASGNYDVELRAATSAEFPDSAFHVEVDGLNATGTVVLPDTGGWSNYQWIGKNTVPLTAGTHVLKIVSERPYFALNSVRVTATAPLPDMADTSAPTVTMTAPSNGATVSGTVQVAANASDDVGVEGVQFKLNGNNLAAEERFAPYEITWDTTGVSNGSHSLTAVARDAAGNTRTATLVTVTVDNGSPDPGAVLFSCTFANLPTDCGFREQAKVPGRASIVNVARDGATAVRLHTEPGDNNVAGSGTMERNDLWLSQADSDGYEGREAWWAHSLFLPEDFALPTWHNYVLFDFHNSDTGGGQANFHVLNRNGVLTFQGYGGITSGNEPVNPFSAPIGPIQKNVWYDFVYHVRWSSGSDGFFDAWVNGQKILAHRGPTLYAGQGVYLKLANYHVPVCDPYPACIGTHAASSVIHDRVIRGTTALAVSSGPLEGVLELVEGVLIPLVP
jgi:hypothetical protein